MSGLVTFITNYVHGVADGVHLGALRSTLSKSRTLQRAVARSVLLNGVVYLGLAAFCTYVLSPFILRLLQVPSSPPGFLDLLKNPTYFFYYVPLSDFLLLGPVYVIQMILGILWNAEVGKLVCIVERKGSAEVVGLSNLTLAVSMIGDEVYRILMELCFKLINWGFCTFFLSQIPVLGFWIGSVFTFLVKSWLAALIPFLYIWGNMNLRIGQCLPFMEQRWCYFAGYGAPWILIQMTLPSSVGGAAASLMLPLHIIVASSRRPPLDPIALPLFALPIKAADSLLQLVFRKKRPHRTRQQSVPLPSPPPSTAAAPPHTASVQRSSASSSTDGPSMSPSRPLSRSGNVAGPSRNSGSFLDNVVQSRLQQAMK